MNHFETCPGNYCGLCCIKIENFGVTFGKATILKDVNLHIHCGEMTALIGPNGAGKSTLLKAILGEYKHTGELKYLDEKGIRSGHPLIGYVPQFLDFDAGSPASVFDLFMASISKAPAWLMKPESVRKMVLESLDRVNEAHLIDRPLGVLSGGELQRVLLALALNPIPDLLLLDEPFTGVDQNGMEIFYNIVSDLKKNYDLSVILVSHDLDLVARYADRVVLLNRTVLCSGKPDEVFSNEILYKTIGMPWLKNSYKNAAASEGEVE